MFEHDDSCCSKQWTPQEGEILFVPDCCDISKPKHTEMQVFWERNQKQSRPDKTTPRGRTPLLIVYIPRHERKAETSESGLLTGWKGPREFSAEPGEERVENKVRASGWSCSGQLWLQVCLGCSTRMDDGKPCC